VADAVKKNEVESGFVPGFTLFPYRVKMTCGHIEERKMRQATAGGVEYDPNAEWQVKAPYAECAACRAAKGET
jgi:hypothetical protein